MATIGTFTKSEDGSLTGAIKTLTLNVKVAQLRPVDKDNDKAPDYRIFSGAIEFGAAWKKTSRENNDYLSVKLDDSGFGSGTLSQLRNRHGEVETRCDRGRPTCAVDGGASGAGAP